MAAAKSGICRRTTRQGRAIDMQKILTFPVVGAFRVGGEVPAGALKVRRLPLELLRGGAYQGLAAALGERPHSVACPAGEWAISHAVQALRDNAELLHELGELGLVIGLWLDPVRAGRKRLPARAASRSFPRRSAPASRSCAGARRTRRPGRRRHSRASGSISSLSSSSSAASVPTFPFRYPDYAGGRVSFRLTARRAMLCSRRSSC